MPIKTPVCLITDAYRIITGADYRSFDPFIDTKARVVTVADPWYPFNMVRVPNTNYRGSDWVLVCLFILCDSYS